MTPLHGKERALGFGWRQSAEEVFEVDLKLPPDAPLGRLGGRVFARFDLGSEPFFWQARRRVRQLLLSVLGV